LLLDRLPAPDESRPGAVAYGWRGLTDLLEQRGWTVADAVATVADVLNGLPGPDQEGESLGEAALPFEVVEWVRDQPRARDREFVVVCVPSDPNGGVAPTPIPRPAVDLPRPDDIFARERRQRDAEVKALTDMVQRILETVDHQALLTLDASVGDKAAAATARLAAERARADAVAAAATNTQQLLELRASFGEALKAAKVAMRKEANHRVAAERHRVALQYRSSMSYRLGRAITAPGRLAGRVLRRLLRRRPKGR
jgi:hypothetical protein